MKSSKSDWLLAICWLLYLTLLGPFALSARDWFLFVAAIVAPIGLIYWTVKAVKHHMGVKDNA